MRAKDHLSEAFHLRPFLKNRLRRLCGDLANLSVIEVRKATLSMLNLSLEELVADVRNGAPVMVNLTPVIERRHREVIRQVLFS